MTISSRGQGTIQMYKFMSHVSHLNLVRLVQALLNKNQLTPAESQLAEYAITETDLNIEIK